MTDTTTTQTTTANPTAVACLVKSYHHPLSQYHVETVDTHKHGVIDFSESNAGRPQVVAALRNGTPIRLIFDRTVDGQDFYVFASKKQMASAEASEAEQIGFFLSLAEQDADAAKQVLEVLYATLGEHITTEEKYSQALQVLKLNRKLRSIPCCAKEIWTRCSPQLQTRIWLDGTLPYTSNAVVGKAWAEADAEGKRRILSLLGLSGAVLEQDLPAAHPAAPVQDNASASTEELVQQAVSSAVSERRSQVSRLQERRTEQAAASARLTTADRTLSEQRRQVETERRQRINAATTQAERREAEQTARTRMASIEAQQQSVQQQLRQAESEVERTDRQIEATRTEIRTIEQTANTATIGGRGKLKVNLKWGTYDDLDLHVVDPAGQEIYYNRKAQTCQGVVGRLDVDMNAGNGTTRSPQENIYWEDAAPVGDYKVTVDLFCKRDTGFSKVPYTVTVIPEKGEPKTFTGVYESGSERVQVVTEFSYDDSGIHYKQTPAASAA